MKLLRDLHSKCLSRLLSISLALAWITTASGQYLQLYFDASGNLTNQSLASFGAPQILSGPTTRIVQPGESASFFVLMANAGPFDYQWRFNGTNLVAKTNDTLLVLNVGTTNQGGYSVVVTNSYGSVTSSVAQLYLDVDRDELPDSWEIANFGNITSQRSLGDPDGDGISNYDEFRADTIPTTNGSSVVTLTILASGGAVAVSPVKSFYTNGEVVTLTAIPLAPNPFYGWSGAINSISNPVTLTMNGHKTVRAHFIAPPPPPGLVGWWRGESNAFDALGLNHGVASNGASYVEGKVGQGFVFDGVNDFINIPDAPALRPASITLETWAMFNSSSGAIISRAFGSGIENSYLLYLESGILRGFVKSASGAYALSSYSLNPVFGQWYHVAYSFDGLSGQHRLYLNGVPVAAGSTPIQIGYDNHPVLLGGDIDNGVPGFPFNGRVDEAAIYNRALTTNEIAGIYMAGFGRKSTFSPYFTSSAQFADAAPFVAYTQQVTTAFGTSPPAFSLSAGLLPAGLTLSSLGVIGGVPTVPGLYTFAITVTDAIGSSAEQLCTLRVLQPAMPPGLVAWWRAETNALDSAGTNHGVASNGVAYVAGRVGQSFGFDGVNDYVNIPDVAALRPASITLEAWAMFNAPSGPIISRTIGSGIADSYILWVLNNGTLNGAVCDAGGATTVLSFSFNPVLGQWYHLAYSFDDLTKQQSLYVNGVRVATSQSNRSIGYDNHPVLLGGDIDNGSPSFLLNGRVDEAAIYNRALTTNEVAAIYNAGAAGKTSVGPYINTESLMPPAFLNQTYTQTVAAFGGMAPIALTIASGVLPGGLTMNSSGLISGTPTNSGQYTFVVRATDVAAQSSDKSFSLQVVTSVSPPAGIIGWWRAESNALDTIGANHGVASNGASYVEGKVGQSFVFDGVNDFVNIPDAPALRPASITLEAWAMFNSPSGPIIARATGSAVQNTYVLYLDNNTLRGFITDAGGTGVLVSHPLVPVSGQWYHVAFSFDNVSKEQALYINGVRVATSLSNRSIGYDNHPVLIGGDIDNGVPGFPFNGRIDEAAIYNRALTTNEIAAIYAAGISGKAALGPYFATLPELPFALYGQTYTQTLTAARAVAPVAYSLNSGSLPSGLTINSAGLITGTPTNIGQYNFVVRATDSNSLSGNQLFSLRVLPAVPPPAGLVGWWRAESNAVDSASSSDGVLTNGTGFGLGKVGLAFQLDGINDTVEISDVAAFHPPSLTLEAWVLLDATNGTRQIFAKPFGSGTINSFALYVTNGVLAAFVGDAIGNGAVLTNYAPLTPGVWYHVAYTFDSVAQEQILYVNGEAVGAGTLGRFINVGYDAQPVVLGADIQNGSRTFYFMGRIDEAAIYDRALGVYEIAALVSAGPGGKTGVRPYLNIAPTLSAAAVGQSYSQTLISARAFGAVSYLVNFGTLPPGLTLSSNGILGGIPTVGGDFSFTVRATDALNLYGDQTFTLTVDVPAQWATGLVAWWRAETNALDAIGTNHGALSNGVVFASGKVGQSFSFDGVNDFVRIADATNLRPQSLTVEAWINITLTNGTRMIFAKPVGSGVFDSFGVFIANGILQAQVGSTSSNSSVVSAPSALVPRRWYHIVYTFNHSTTQQVLYVDSLFAAGATADRQMGFDANPMLLGADFNGGVPGIFFSGQIDEPAIYSRALTATEVAELYQADVAGKRQLSSYEQWNWKFFGNALAPGFTDFDQDGFNNVSEFIADTDPTNASSFLRITEVKSVERDVWVQWQGGILATQILQTALGLNATNQWADLFTNIPPTTEFNTFTNAYNTNQFRFYRIRAFR